MTGLGSLRALDFPEHVVLAVEQRRWSDLEEALASGLPANLYSQSYGMSLVEFVIAHQESLLELDRPSEKSLPLSLLDRFLAQGVPERPEGSSMGLVGLSVQGGQWDWGSHLLGLGYPAEAAGAKVGTLHGLLRGVFRRGQVRTLLSIGQVFQDMLMGPVLEGAEKDSEAEAEIFFKLLGERITSPEHHVAEEAAALDSLKELLAGGGDLGALARGVRKTCQPLLLPVQQAVLMRSPLWVTTLLDAHDAQGVPLPVGLIGFTVTYGGPLHLKALLGHALVQALPGLEKEAAAFEAVHRPGSGVLAALEEGGLDLAGCRDVEGWDLMQRAAEAGSVSSLLHLLVRGQALEASREVGPSPADLLRLHHPNLCEVFGVAVIEETPSVRMLRPRP